MKSKALSLYLASTSPRRQKILSDAQIQFTFLPIKVSEKIEKNLNSDEQIKAIAQDKMRAAQAKAKDLKLQDFVLLTADTMVVLGDEALGKPKDATDAEAILTRLSARFHEVKTAISVCSSLTGKTACDIQTTQIWFRKISLREIQDYVKSGEPMDKAGAYGIQGEARKFVDKIVGDHDNVVGLPMQLLQNLFLRIGTSLEDFKK